MDGWCAINERVDFVFIFIINTIKIKINRVKEEKERKKKGRKRRRVKKKKKKEKEKEEKEKRARKERKKIYTNNLGYGLDLSAKLLLDLVQVEAVLIGDEVDGETEMAIPTATTNAMKVCLTVLGKVEIDHYVHGLDVNSPSK